jgi:signal transduction histidine kinase
MLSSGPAGVPRGFLALILGATIVPLLTLLWLEWRLLGQDRVLEREQVQQRVERAADLVVGDLQRAVADAERRLEAGDDEWPEGAVVLTFRGRGVGAAPRGNVAYLPVTHTLPEAATGVLAEAEALEFRARDFVGAAAAYRRHARSGEPHVRAAALLGLGRTLRKAGRPDEALGVYERLAGIDRVAASGTPVSLVATYARGEILEEESRPDELRELGARLDRDLTSARWELTGPLYVLYSRDAVRWSGAGARGLRDAELLAAAGARLWPRWRSALTDAPPSASCEVLDVDGAPVTVLWSVASGARRALLAAPSFVRSHWLARALPAATAHDVEVGLRGAAGRFLFGTKEAGTAFRAARPASETGLPWAVVSASRMPPGEHAAFARRRRLVAAGLVLVVAMALVSGWLAVRSVLREREVARLQSDFVAAVSHEFRTPLTALRQFTDRLIEQPGLDVERRQVAYAVQSRATARLTRLVESMLDLGRMEAGARPFRLERLDGTELVRRAVLDFGEDARATGHRLELRADEPVAVEADAEALSQAVRNLLENAVKYSPSLRPVQVRVARAGDRARISVHDQGIGIPKEEQAAIFAKFRRGQAARGLGIRGTGVGLAIVDGIAKAHGGRVTVESVPGEGSTFTIDLPARS